MTANVFVLLIAVPAFFVVERLGVYVLTCRETRIEWVRQHTVFHPNTISFVRVPMGCVTVALWIGGLQTIGILWFAFWMITDLTDGSLARKCNLASERGKWLDPLSDKCMYFPVLLAFAVLDLVPMGWAVGLVLIDSFGQISRRFTRKTAANYFGKAKTALITILLALVAVYVVGDFGFISAKLLYLLTVSCAVLAFLSVCCKIIPDNWYANALTLANFLCGVGAVAVLFNFEKPIYAFILIFAGQFFDLFDGRLARKFGSTPHGAIYDDIADATNFGLAVGVLVAYQLSFHPVAIGVAILYFVAIVYRLFRFVRNQQRMPDGVFEGLPSPAGALLVASSVFVVELLTDALALQGGVQLCVSTVLVLFCSFLVVSRLHYLHFAKRIWPALPNMVKVSIFILLLILLNLMFANRAPDDVLKVFCFLIAWLYVFAGREGMGEWLRLRTTGRAEAAGMGE